MSQDIIVVGAGGFGREVVDVIEAINAQSANPPFSFLGVVDDAPTPENLQRLTARGIKHLGGTAEAAELPQGTAYAVGIGNPAVRRAVADRLDEAGLMAAALIHPSVTMGVQVTIGEGSVICAGVRITTNIVIGRHVHLNLNATVGHDSVIEDFVSVNPLSSISGDCTIRTGSLLGVSSSVLNMVTIGAGATVGGGACAVRDVAPDTIVVGVPAKPLQKGKSA